jgi:uncharacterized protein YgiM (DUF1202 family)
MDKHTDKYGNVTYGGEARQNQNVDDTKAAYGGAADAAYNMVSSWSIQTTFAICGVGLVGTLALVMASTIPSSLGIYINWSIKGYLIFIVILVIASKILFHIFPWLMKRVITAILALLLASLIVPRFIGTGSMTAAFKTQKATVNSAEAGLRAAPSANAEVLQTLKQGRSLGVVGVTPDGWMRVVLPIEYKPSKPGEPNEDHWDFIEWITGSNTIKGSGWINVEQVTTNNGAQPRTIQNAQVISNTLNMRYFPRINAGRTGTALTETGEWIPPADKGDTVQVLGPERNGWVPVFTGNGKKVCNGYALASSLAIEGAATKALTLPHGTPATAAKDVNMQLARRHAEFFTAKRIKKGEAVILLDPKPTKNEWYHIWFDGEEGWVGTYTIKLN